MNCKFEGKNIYYVDKNKWDGIVREFFDRIEKMYVDIGNFKLDFDKWG